MKKKEAVKRENRVSATALLKEGNQLKKAGELSGAMEKYSEALQLNPESVPTLNHMGHIYEMNAQVDKAIATYEKAIELNPNNPNLHWRIAEFYSQEGDLPQAIDHYQQAIRLKPDLPYSIYVSLANALKQEGREDEATTWLKYPKEVAIYSQIWKALNQTNLQSLDENILPYTTEINQKTVFQFFQQTSEYKIINLGTLKEKDKQFLESVGLSLKYLKLNQEKLITSEGVAQVKSRISLDFQELHWSMVKEVGLYAICPSTGKVLKSNRSLPLDEVSGSCSYRFVGNEVFYLILRRSAQFFKNYLYFPRLDLIVLFDLGLSVDKNRQNISNSINFLKTNAVTFWQKLHSYLVRTDEAETAVVIQHGSIWHYLFNILPAIQKLYDQQYLDKVNKFITIDPEFYGNINDIFPEINSDKIEHLNKSSKGIFEKIIENNYFALRIIYCPKGTPRGNGDRIKDKLLQELIERVLQKSEEKCSATCLTAIEEAKTNCFPLIWIGIRIHNQVWLSQEEGIANIIKNLHSRFPNLGVIFDGFTRQEKGGKVVINPEIEKRVEEEKKFVTRIQSSLPQEIKIYNNIGCFMYESLTWARSIDLCFEPCVSSTLKTGISNKPKIVHGSNTLRKANRLDVDGVIDVNEGDPRTDYDFDWRIAYEKLLGLASNLRRS